MVSNTLPSSSAKPALYSPDAIWLVDSSIYVFRAWFVRQPTATDRDNNPINAVLGFLRFVYQLLHEQQPKHLAFAFDVSLKTSEREHIYPDYKANRSPAPEELKYQFQLCRRFLDALGIVQDASQHHEADDVIGTWSVQQRAAHQNAQRNIVILSGDKDLAQLVHDRDLWWDYGRRKPLNTGGIKSTFGVWPQQIADQLAIAGDKTDNIPGVPGVGMSTAAKLLKRFNTLDTLFANTADIAKMQIRGAKRVQLLLEEHQETVRLARRLTGINCTVPNLATDLRRRPKDTATLQNLCELLQLNDQQYDNWLAV